MSPLLQIFAMSFVRHLVKDAIHPPITVSLALSDSEFTSVKHDVARWRKGNLIQKPNELIL